MNDAIIRKVEADVAAHVVGIDRVTIVQSPRGSHTLYSIHLEGPELSDMVTLLAPDYVYTPHFLRKVSYMAVAAVRRAKAA